MTPPERKKASIRRAGRLLFGSPRKVVGRAEINDGYKLVTSLWGILQKERVHVDNVVTSDNGSIDLHATASSYAVSVTALKLYFEQIQHITFRRTWYGIALVAAMILGWGYVGIAQTRHTPGILTAIEFIPVWAAAGLFVVHNAWMNWQMRTQTIRPMRHFLRTADSLLPKPPV